MQETSLYQVVFSYAHSILAAQPTARQPQPPGV